MITQVKSSLEQRNIKLNGKSVTVALSGGADSVALLRVMCELRLEYDISLKAVHINHCLRGDESDGDEQFCRKLCRQLGVPLEVRRVNVKEQIQGTGMGVEQGARELRYEIFDSIADGGYVATAHTLDDCAETLIFNITRGSSLKGLASIPFQRGAVIRPLLDMTREQIEEYLKKLEQNYVTDSSNLTNCCTRNKIRHIIIPVLKALNPSFLDASARLSKSAALAQDYIDKAARQLIDEHADAKQVLAADKAVQCAYIDRRCKDELNIAPEQIHIDAALAAIAKNSRCQLPCGAQLRVHNGAVKLAKNQPRTDDWQITVSAGINKTPYKEYHIQIIDYAEYKLQQNVNNLLFKNAVDYDKIGDSPILRGRKDGDCVRLKGRGCTKTVGKLFCEAKIDLPQRGKIALLCSADRIAWVEGFGVSEAFSPDENTKRVLVIRIGDDLH